MPPHARGAIVLAAYRPDPELFARQLRSLQAQTVDDWECVVSVDGERQPVADLVAEITSHDSRFRVIGDGRRRGFYGNFETGLKAVQAGTAWVALCDQDDNWRPEKLETLLPHLTTVSLISGQAQLVRYPTEQVIGVTDRRDVDTTLTTLSNQFTGSLLVFDAALLPIALPFPRASTRVASHDHWLAVVASAHRGTRVIDAVVQDYVQHDANVYGDPSQLGGFDPLASLRNVLGQAQRYEGSRSPAGVARMAFWTYVGWRQLMVDTVASRAGSQAPSTHAGDLVFGANRRYRPLSALLRSATASGFVARRFALEYRASWCAGLLVGGRSLVRRALAQPSAPGD